jgi:hypothetical protein
MEELITSIFTVKAGQLAVCFFWFLAWLHFDREDGDDIVL